MARKLASRTTKAAKKSAKTVWPMTLLHKSKCIQILSEVTFLIIKFRYCEKTTNTVKLGNKERFYKEQIGIKEPFPVTNFPFTS